MRKDLHKAGQKWVIYNKRADMKTLSARFGVSPLLIRLMANRDVLEEDMQAYLRSDFSDMGDPWLLKDMDKAVDIILEKISGEKKIRIIGDYDIDGVCSTFLLMKALGTLGADVDYDIPDRRKDGYGLSIGLVEKAANADVNTILTCDNGIAAFAEIEYARSLGMTVVVTDHHDIYKNEDGSDRLPNAHAIINPHRSDDEYPFEKICGAVVAYKLMRALYERCDIDEWMWRKYIIFAAIATVGDVMPLVGENRTIVRLGLKAADDAQNIGLLKIIECCNLNKDALSAYHFGFVIGPCLNAGGRLESAKTSLAMFLSDSDDEGTKRAVHLKELNDERKAIQNEAFEKALDQVEEKYLDDDVLVVYLEDCHESIAGIVAGKVREIYEKPTLILTDTTGGYAKGSGRSIEAYNMFESICTVSDLLVKYGGHPMACGITLEKDKIDELRQRLNDGANLTCDDKTTKISIDAEVPFYYFKDVENIRELGLLEPFGNGNKQPLFARRGVRIEGTKLCGKNQNVLRVNMIDTDGSRVSGVLFKDIEEFLDVVVAAPSMDIIYQVSIDEYRGNFSAKFTIYAFRPRYDKIEG